MTTPYTCTPACLLYRAAVQIYLPALQLLPNTEPRSVLLPLKGAASSKAALHVSVAWLKSTRQQQQQHRRSSTGGNTSPAAAAGAAPAADPAAGSSASTPVVSEPPSPSPAGGAGARQHSVPGKSVTWHDEVRTLLLHTLARACW
jgi:hypothetical protein